MEKNLKEMQKRHQKEINELKNKCFHKILTNWIITETKEVEIKGESINFTLWNKCYKKYQTVPAKKIKKCIDCDSIIKTAILTEVWEEENL